MKPREIGRSLVTSLYYRRLVVSALIFVAAFPVGIPVYAEVVHSLQMSRLTPSSTLRRGGSGGWNYNLSCSEGWVLVGVNARAGSWLDRIQGICSRVTSSGAWTGSRSNTSSAGGPGGTATSRLCPSGYAINGFDGRAGGYIDQLIVVCSRLTSSNSIDGARSIRLPAIGGSGGSAFTTTTCSRPARSIVGKAGTAVDSIEFACESSPVMSRSQIDSALAGATSILKSDSGANDVACDVRTRRTGRVRIEPSNGLWNISSSTEMDKACGLLGFGVVTNQITYCDGFGSSFVGCARPGCMVVVPYGSGSGRSTLWAHEFGHTRALPHRNGSGNIMNWSISINDGGTLINSGECSAYVNPVTSFFFGFLPGEEGDDAKMSLQDFVSQTFVHGIPYEKATAYGPEVVPELIGILRDAKQEDKWSTAATMLAMIGEPQGVDAVIEFIEKADATDPSSLSAWARRNAVLSLGYSAGKDTGTKPLQYLQDSLQPEAWKKRGLRDAKGPQPRILKTDEDDIEIDEETGLDEELTEMAVIGLALSGRAEARKALENYTRAPGRSQRDKALADNALREHAKVSNKGIRAYDNERISRASERAAAAKREAEYRKKAKGKANGDIEFEDAVEPALPDSADENTGGEL